MNERQQRASAQILAIIAALPWQERAHVWSDVEFNDSICVHCGMETEKYGCQCQNDE